MVSQSERKERQGGGEWREEERERQVSGGVIGTYVYLPHCNVNQGAQHNDEVKTVPGVAEIILERGGKEDVVVSTK